MDMLLLSVSAIEFSQHPSCNCHAEVRLRALHEHYFNLTHEEFALRTRRGSKTRLNFGYKTRSGRISFSVSI